MIRRDGVLRAAGLAGPALVLVLGTGLGCKVYHPLPLDRQAKEAALQRPDPERIRIEAKRLVHPLLKPLTIDPAAPLSPEAAAVVAVLANPDLKAIRGQRALAEAQLLDAGLLPDPILSYTRDVPVGGADQGAVAAHSVQLSMDLTSLLTRSLRRRAARAEQQSVDLDVAWQEWQVAEAAKLSVLRLGTLEPQKRVADASVQALAEVLDCLEKAAAQGAASLGDVAGARAALDAGRREALGLGRDGERERQMLNALLGLPPEARVPLASQGSAWDGLPTQEELFQGLDHRLDLVALEKGYESEDARVRLAIWSQFPSIGISLSQGQDTTPVKTRGGGVSLSLPIFNGGRGLVAIENATRQQLHDQYLARLVHARADLAQVAAEREAVGTMLTEARQALPILEAQAGASETAFKAGNLDLPGRNLARLARLDQEATILGLRRNLDELGVALELASGRTLSAPTPETPK